jgi:hypothetical protein
MVNTGGGASRQIYGQLGTSGECPCSVMVMLPVNAVNIQIFVRRDIKNAKPIREANGSFTIGG